MKSDLHTCHNVGMLNSWHSDNKFFFFVYFFKRTAISLEPSVPRCPADTTFYLYLCINKHKVVKEIILNRIIVVV